MPPTVDQVIAAHKRFTASLPTAEQAAASLARMGDAMRNATNAAHDFADAGSAAMARCARLSTLRAQAKRKGRPGWRAIR
jgi:hypothetical protein